LASKKQFPSKAFNWENELPRLPGLPAAKSRDQRAESSHWPTKKQFPSKAFDSDSQQQRTESRESGEQRAEMSAESREQLLASKNKSK